jgi:hypothetical protein
VPPLLQVCVPVPPPLHEQLWVDPGVHVMEVEQPLQEP